MVAEPGFALEPGFGLKDQLSRLPHAGGPGGGLLICKVRSKHHFECFVAKQTPGPHPTESTTLDVRPAGGGAVLVTETFKRLVDLAWSGEGGQGQLG